MKILIFKTDIQSERTFQVVKSIFSSHPGILVWTVDTDDIDNVLRIEATDDLSENAIIQMISPTGVYCEELTD